MEDRLDSRSKIIFNTVSYALEYLPGTVLAVTRDGEKVRYWVGQPKEDNGALRQLRGLSSELFEALVLKCELTSENQTSAYYTWRG